MTTHRCRRARRPRRATTAVAHHGCRGRAARRTAGTSSARTTEQATTKRPRTDGEEQRDRPAARRGASRGFVARPESRDCLAVAGGAERLDSPGAEHGGDHQVDHDQDPVGDEVARRPVLLGLHERLGELGVGDDVPDRDGDQDQGVLAFELHPVTLGGTPRSPSRCITSATSRSCSEARHSCATWTTASTSSTQPGAAGLHGHQHALLVVVELAGVAAEQHLGVAHDGGQGRPELVVDQGQQLGAGSSPCGTGAAPARGPHAAA